MPDTQRGPTVPGDRHLPAGDTTRRYGNEAYDLLVRLFTLIDQGRRDLLRKQYVEMMGVRHVSDVEQDRILLSSKAYMKAVGELEGAIERDKRLLREIFDRASGPMTPDEKAAHSIRRRARLQRLRIAQTKKIAALRDEYEKKKKLYETRFESIEADAYTKGAERIEDDRKRYEALSAEFEGKLKQEQEAILQAQKALESVEATREEAEKEMARTRKVEQETKDRVKAIAEQLRSMIEGLEKLGEFSPTPPKLY